MWNYMLCDFRMCIGKSSVWISLQEGRHSLITSAVTASMFFKKGRKKNKAKQKMIVVTPSVQCSHALWRFSLIFCSPEFSESSYKVTPGCSRGLCCSPRPPFLAGVLLWSCIVSAKQSLKSTILDANWTYIYVYIHLVLFAYCLHF